MGETERKEKERAGWKRVKRFAIVCLVVLIIDGVAAIFLWEWDGIYYIIWGTWAVVGIYADYMKRKLDGRL